MMNTQAISIHDTQPIRTIKRSQLSPKPQNASGREARSNRWPMPAQLLTPLAGVEAMRRFVDEMRNMP